MNPQVDVLYENIHNLPLNKAIAHALTYFLTSPNTEHRTPEEVHIHPADYDGCQLPARNLKLVLDKQVKAVLGGFGRSSAGRCRVVLADVTDSGFRLVIQDTLYHIQRDWGFRRPVGHSEPPGSVLG
jgi:hypothetical protein